MIQLFVLTREDCEGGKNYKLSFNINPTVLPIVDTGIAEGRFFYWSLYELSADSVVTPLDDTYNIYPSLGYFPPEMPSPVESFAFAPLNTTTYVLLMGYSNSINVEPYRVNVKLSETHPGDQTPEVVPVVAGSDPIVHVPGNNTGTTKQETTMNASNANIVVNTIEIFCVALLMVTTMF